MKNQIYTLIFIIQSASAFAASEIGSVKFSVDRTSNESVIEISSSEAIKYTSQPNSEDRQLIIDLPGTKLLDSAPKSIDASSYPSVVSLVSTYAVDDTPDLTRMVVQMREWQEPVVSGSGNTIRIAVPASPAVVAAMKEMGEAAPSAPPVEAPAAKPKTVAKKIENKSAPNSEDDEIADAAAADDRMGEFLNAHDKQVFKGKPITLQARDMEVRDIIRLIGDASGFNIIIADDVNGRLTLSLTDVPWDQVLDIVLRSLNLGADRTNNVLRIMPMGRLVQQKNDEQRLKDVSSSSEPRITKIIPVNYANPDELISTVQEFVNSRNSGSSNSAVKAVVRVDRRTNSIVMQDTQEGIDKTVKLIQLLDTQTPQVMIEAKIVDASEGFAKTIGGSLGFGSVASDSSEAYLTSFAGGNPIDALISGSNFNGSTVLSGGREFATLSAQPTASGAAFGATFRTAFIPGVERINAILAMTESEQQAKVVSSPRVVVLNKESASIVQGIPILIPKVTNNAAGSAQGIESSQAKISLSVTPQVTNDESVLMQLSISRDSTSAGPGGTSLPADRNITTKVLVESGTTLVIGGVYSSEESKAESGFPFLRKLPLIGNFFGSETSNKSRSELFIFITPKILNTKKSGIST
ncbi:MAG: type IV pilus secretin PilQ [Xanthomonadaceae bacterium]|nr:type IV pilus secretin PilQ [Xanthomonadaceae bacterium]